MLEEQNPAEAGAAQSQQNPEAGQNPEATENHEAAGPAAPSEAPTAEAAPQSAPRKRAPRKRAAARPATTTAAVEPTEPTGTTEAPGTDVSDTGEGGPVPAKRAPRKRAAKKAAPPQEPVGESPDEGGAPGTDQVEASEAAPEKKPTMSRKKAAPAGPQTGAETGAEQRSDGPEPTPDRTDTEAGPEGGPETGPAGEKTPARRARAPRAKAAPVAAPLFQAPDSAPDETPAAPRRRARKTAPAPEPDEQTGVEAAEGAAALTAEAAEEVQTSTLPDAEAEAESEEAAEGAEGGEDTEGADGSEDAEGTEGAARRRRRRGGRRRRRGPGDTAGESAEDAETDASADEKEAADAGTADSEGEQGEGSASSRRRRRRRRAGEGEDEVGDDPENTVTRVRKARSAEDEITGFSGSTRLEAKKQRRREGREAGRRRAPIISEAEFLARRESVDRAMVIRQRGDLTQIAVLEDRVLVEHYVARESQTSLIGNIYLGRVQNVLPSMEAAFIDIGKGRNAVLYAGEVNWDALGAKEGSQRKIEQVLKPGQSVLVQVTKDPIGHKGARLTSQISLPGRFLVYVPDGTTSGISRKLPENERNRLKSLLKEIVPDSAGVIVRTAAEGASENELTRDVERLKALWEDISAKVEGGSAPQLLYGEPDLTLKVVRDLFTEDFGRLVVSGDEAWEMVEAYVGHVAPDLVDRLERHDDSERDAFAEYRIDEQIAKALDRKVWLPSGGSLIIDRTEAMTVIDVNTGKFTGSGGNLEETVTKNNLEAAEEIVRQLRLRDIGGIIVVDFIDMVLESNRDLVLRRLIECLGRDRTRHQVAEVTSLGLVQMTRKRIGTGLLEAFSETCEPCGGRGLILHPEPVESRRRPVSSDEEPKRGRRNRGRGRGGDEANGGPDAAAPNGARSGGQGEGNGVPKRPTPAEFAAMARADQSESAQTPVDEAKARPEAETESETGAETQSPSQAESVLPTQAETQAETQSQSEPDAQPESQPESEPETQAESVLEARAESQPESEPETRTESQPESEPETQVGGPAPDGTAPVSVPTTPRIVTTVRRGGARRPAGPPAAGSGASTGGGEGDAYGHGLSEGEQGTAAHVPVKRKGSRKR